MTALSSSESRVLAHHVREACMEVFPTETIASNAVERTEQWRQQFLEGLD